MMLWPRIDAASSEATVLPAPWSGLSAASPEANNARPVDLASSPVPAAASPPLDPTASRSPPSGAKGRTRLLAALALLVSTGLHAAVLAIFLERLSQAGVEAETDAVSVEIVLDVPPAPTVATSGGMPAEAVPEPQKTTAVEAAPPELLQDDDIAAEPEKNAPADPPVEQRQEAVVADITDPDAAEPIQQVHDAPDKRPGSEPADEAPAAPPPPESGPPTREQPALDQVAEPAPNATTSPPLKRIAAIVPRDPVAELTPPLPMPEAVPQAPEASPPETVFAQAPPPEVDAPTPSPRPAYQVAEAKPEKRVKETATAEAAKPVKRSAEIVAPAGKSKASQKPVEKEQKPTRSSASTAGSASAKGGASAGAAAKYGQRLLSHVERHKRYPQAAARQKITGATKLAITIDRSGQLAGAKVAVGSGHTILDEEAVAVARRAAPYPRPPDGVGGGTISFSVTLRFKR